MITLRAGARSLLREGSVFAELLAEAKKSQWLDGARLAQFHRSRLQALLKHAITQVPFYRSLGIEPQRIDADPESVLLSQFPVLDKVAVREAGQDLLAEQRSRSLFKGSTSGTTGSPLTLFQDLQAINRENAFITRQLEWAGWRPGGRRAWIRGDLVVPTSENNPPFWRMNHAERMLMFSSYHLSEQHALAYIGALENFDPAIIQAYPSSINFLAKWLAANGRHYAAPSLNGIVTSSETLDAGQRQLIEEHFGCRVFDWYGQFERVAAIGTCEYGEQHIVSDYSYVELFPVGEDLYEIVGTGFNNFAMPLIRYRTGDFVSLGEAGKSCACGRHFPLVASIKGRADDTVKLPDGRHVGRLDHVFKGVEGILEAQIRQDRIDQIEILVVPTAGYGPAVEARLLANAGERLGESVQVSVRSVAGIERTRNGKLRGVVCNV